MLQPSSNSENFNRGTNYQSPLHLKYHNASVEIPNLPSSDDCGTTYIDSTPTGHDSIDEPSPNLDSSPHKISHPTRTLYYPSLEKCVTLEADLQVLLQGLFYLLVKFNGYLFEKI